MEETLSKKRLGGSSTKLLEIKEKADRPTDRQTGTATSTTTTTAAVKLLRGIHISELYGTTINPEPKGGMDILVDKTLGVSSTSSSSSMAMRSSKPRQTEISAAAKSEFVVDKDIIVTEHLTENLMRQLTGCTELRLVDGLVSIVSSAVNVLSVFCDHKFHSNAFV